jgi:hypothetical protein
VDVLAISSQSPFSVIGENFGIPIPLLDNTTQVKISPLAGIVSM